MLEKVETWEEEEKHLVSMAALSDRHLNMPNMARFGALIRKLRRNKRSRDT